LKSIAICECRSETVAESGKGKVRLPDCHFAVTLTVGDDGRDNDEDDDILLL
jgi:hypothetical protein